MGSELQLISNPAGEIPPNFKPKIIRGIMDRKKPFRYSNQTNKAANTLLQVLQQWSSDEYKTELFSEVDDYISDLWFGIKSDQKLYVKNYDQYLEQYNQERLKS